MKNGQHKRLRPQHGKRDCDNVKVWQKISYGHEFESFCLIARLPEHAGANSRLVSSLAFALQRGLCRLLEVEPSDIGVTGRWRANRNSFGSIAEIVLFDNSPGGAGFVSEGFENWEQVERHALAICQSCSCEADKACYDCLKDYSNQSHHEQLSRNLITDFLQIPVQN